MPTEVESVILELSIIQDCTVIGIPNSITGQMVGANITLSEPMDIVNAKAIVKKHCASKLDKYKVPVKIFVVEKLDVSNRFKKIR